MKRIPIAAAKRIAEEYGYDQVMIYARKVGEDGGEHMTTYGVTKVHCAVMAKAAKFLQTVFMGWHGEERTESRHLSLLKEINEELYYAESAGPDLFKTLRSVREKIKTVLRAQSSS